MVDIVHFYGIFLFSFFVLHSPAIVKVVHFLCYRKKENIFDIKNVKTHKFIITKNQINLNKNSDVQIIIVLITILVNF